MGKNKKKTHEQFIKEMQIKHPNLEILNEYFNSKTRIKYHCKKCDLYWEATASKLSLGRGCPKCAGNMHKTHEEYVKQLNNINPNILVMSQYKSTSQKMFFKCRICGYEWKTSPGGPLRGKGCLLCGKKEMGKKLRKSHEQFIKEISLINSDIEIIGEYTGDKNKVLCLCKSCDSEWFAYPSSLKAKHSCPSCSSSKGEKEISKLLDENNIKYIPQYKYEGLVGIKGGKLSFDFYLPEYNLLIEYQGKQHKAPIDYFGGIETFERQKVHDNLKRQYAFKNNIKLLEIWYYEDIKEKLYKTLNLETVTTAGC